MSTKPKVWLVMASFPYEGSDVAAAFGSRESAEKFIRNLEKRQSAYSRKLDKDVDPGKCPPHWGCDLDITEMEVKP